MYANLFDFLSSNSGIDHPLCEECTDTLLDMMDKELKNTKQDFQEYSDFLKTLVCTFVFNFYKFDTFFTSSYREAIQSNEKVSTYC